MKKKLIYLAIAGVMVIHLACTKDNILSKEELVEIVPQEPVNPPQEPLIPPQEPVKYKPYTPIELTNQEMQKAGTDNQFAWKIFKKVSELNGKNTFFSPLSLNMALGMLYNGASGETRTEMAEALGMADFTETEINEYYLKMTSALQESDPLTGLSIANSIWYRSGFPVKQPFIDINQHYFDAMVKDLDFSKPSAVDSINNWCAEKTKNKIKEIIEGPIDSDIMMYLMNALYFKGEWMMTFNEDNTKKAVFTTSDNQKLETAIMEQTTYFPYYADKDVRCVELPYGNRAFSMVIVLPENNMDIEQLIDYLDAEKWQNIVDNLENWVNIQLKLPRFKVECDIPLNAPVKNIGMNRIFSGGFEHISDFELYVSGIIQKTVVEVNEKGTEAAAVTSLGFCTSAGDEPPPPLPFFANRPFLYLIKEKSTGVILFIGRLDKPV